MAPFLFTRAILEGRPIDVFNHGRMQRDFTYVDDIVEAVLRVNDRLPAPDPEYSAANPHGNTVTVYITRSGVKPRQRAVGRHQRPDA